MKGYQHILCAVDLTQENTEVFARAQALAIHDQTQLTLLHVVEYVPIDLANELVLPQQQEIEQQLVKQAEKALQEMADSASLPVNTEVVQGSVKSEIVLYAEENNVDLLVLGRHGRHGLSRLLGSVANAVVHHAPCDVLTVRIGE